MAHTINALKRDRQNEKRYMRNKSFKSSVKTQIKKVLEKLESKDIEATKQEFLKTVKMLDKANSKGILHKNEVARKKSRLAIKLNKLLGATGPAGKSSGK